MKVNSVPVKDRLRDMCAGCMGYCCYRFVIRDIWKMEPRPRDRNYTFAMKNFIRLRKPRGLDEVWATCKQHDLVTGKCLAYKSRPQLCRAFHCLIHVRPSRLFPHRHAVMMKKRKAVLDRNPGLLDQAMKTDVIPLEAKEVVHG